MNGPPQNPGDQASDTSRLSLTRFLTTAGFVGLIAVVLGLLWKLNNAAPAVQQENVGLKKELENIRETLADLRRANQLRTEEEQVHRSDFQATAASADEAAKAVESFEKAAVRWDRTTRELLTAESGKAVAANAEALGQFHALWKHPRPGADEPATLRRRLEPLKAVIDKAIAANDTNYAPGEEIVARLKAVRDEAARGAGAYDELNRRLDAIVSAAPQAQAGAENSTLEMALAGLERRIAAEENAAINAAADQARKERSERLAREKAESERLITDAQVETERARKDAEVKRLADEKKAAMAQAAEDERARALALQEAELERKFQAALPEIQRLLKPFITDGSTQLVGGHYRKALTKGKVSYTALKGSGQLEKTTEGVTKLRESMFVDGKNDRELGAFPPYNIRGWEPATTRAQELLIEFGPLMVKKKMLEP